MYKDIEVTELEWKCMGLYLDLLIPVGRIDLRQDEQTEIANKFGRLNELLERPDVAEEFAKDIGRCVASLEWRFILVQQSANAVTGIEQALRVRECSKEEIDVAYRSLVYARPNGLSEERFNELFTRLSRCKDRNFVSKVLSGIAPESHSEKAANET